MLSVTNVSFSWIFSKDFYDEMCVYVCCIFNKNVHTKNEENDELCTEWTNNL